MQEHEGDAPAPVDKPAAATKGGLAAWAKALPASELKPVSGSTTVNDGAGYSAEVVAYSVLDDLVGNIAVVARESGARHVLLVEDRALLDSTWTLRVVRTQLAELDRRLDEVAALLPTEAEESGANADEPDKTVSMLLAGALPIAGAVLEAAPKVVGAVADVVGLLRTNYSVSSRTMTPEGTPVLAAVTHQLRSANILVSIDGFEHVPPTSPLLSDLRGLLEKRDRLLDDTVGLRARTAARQARLERIEKDRAATAAAVVKGLGEGKDVAALEARVSALDDQLETALGESAELLTLVGLVEQTTAAVTTWAGAVLTAPEGGRAPLLAAIAREGLEAAEGGPTHVLFVSLDSAGADIATPSSQVKSTTRLAYSGGMQLSYMLYSVATRKVVAANIRGRVVQATYDLENGTLKLGAGWDLH